MRTKVLALSLCLAVLFVFSCSRPHPEAKLQKINIAFPEWVGYGPLYLAQEKGFFKDEGIELVFIDEQLDSARRDAFNQGMLDVEAGTLDLLVSKRAFNTPVVSVLEIDRSYGADGIVASAKIKNLADLLGKKVAFSRDDAGETLISYLFHQEGLPMERLNIISCNPEKVAEAFLKGEADAAVTWEPWLSLALARPESHLLVTTRENPGIIIDTLNVREDLVKNNPKLVKGLMRAWFRAVKYYQEHPDEASEIIVKYYNITSQQYRKNAEGLQWLDYSGQNQPSIHQQWVDVFNTIAKIKLMNKRIPQKPDAESTINRQLLKELYEDSK